MARKERRIKKSQGKKLKQRSVRKGKSGSKIIRQARKLRPSEQRTVK